MADEPARPRSRVTLADVAPLARDPSVVSRVINADLRLVVSGRVGSLLLAADNLLANVASDAMCGRSSSGNAQDPDR
jgi:hypothetical protein